MINALLNKGQRFKGELLFMFANYLTPAVGFFASTIAAMYMDPKDMGKIQAVLLCLPYLSMLHLGVFNGLARNLAYHFGKQERETGMRMVNASAFVARVNALMGLLFGCVLLGRQFFSATINWVGVWASVVVMVTLICTPYVTHISTTNRSGQHFKIFGKVVLVGNLLRLAYASLPIVIGWIGYLVALVLQPLVQLGLLKIKEPYPACREFKWHDVRELIHVGFPIMIVGYITSLLMVADQTLIVFFLPKEALGHYVLVRLIVRAMIIIPATLSILVSPKVAHRYGATGSAHSLRRYYWAFIWLHLVFIVPICLVGYFTVEPLVHQLLPKYIPGIGAAKITLLTCLTFVAKGAFVITSTMRKNSLMILLHVIALILMWIIGLVMFKLGNPTLESMAWLRFYISLAVALGMLIYGYILTRKDHDDAH